MKAGILGNLIIRVLISLTRNKVTNIHALSWGNILTPVERPELSSLLNFQHLVWLRHRFSELHQFDPWGRKSNINKLFQFTFMVNVINSYDQISICTSRTHKLYCCELTECLLVERLTVHQLPFLLEER